MSRLLGYTLGFARLLIFPTSVCTVNGTVATTTSAAADSTHFHVGTLDLDRFYSTTGATVDYEYQRWNNFPPKSLNPQVISFGGAYHFHGNMGMKKGEDRASWPCRVRYDKPSLS